MTAGNRLFKITPPGRVPILFLGLAALFVFIFARTAHAQKGAYIFVMPLAGNVESKNMIGMLERVAAIAKEATGIPFDIEVPVYAPGDRIIDLVERGFRDGHSDFGYVHAQEYVKYLDAGGDLMRPMFTIKMMGSTSTETCLYVREGDGIKTVADLEGKKWGGSTLIGTHLLLYEAGVKPPPEKFFSEMLFIPDVNKANLIDSLLDGKTDVFNADTTTFKFALSTHERKKEIAQLKCAYQYGNWIFVARKGVPDDVINVIKKTFLRAHKDTKFQEFWWFLAAVKGQFVEFDPKSLERTREIVKLDDKFGWQKKDSKFQAENWNKYFKENKTK